MFNVIVDTREQIPLAIASCAEVAEVINRKLDTGDYTVEGLEQKLVIERKRNVAELAINITEDRFWREMERMGSYEHRFLLLEFGIDDIRSYPEGSTIPKAKQKFIKVKGPFIMKKLSEIQIDYGVDVVFCGDTDNALWMATNIMKRVHARYKPD
jgi:ERCC4-type nuclease